jgi:hypothetical protein
VRKSWKQRNNYVKSFSRPIKRARHLDERIAAYALENAITKEKAAKIIHAAEQQRAMYQHIQRVLGKGPKGGINKILVPDETREDGWRPIFDQVEIAQRLI